MDIDSFRRILKLEEQQDYQDKSIVGGIDTALCRLLTSVESELTSPQELAAFRLMGHFFTPYSKLITNNQKAAWLKGLNIYLETLEDVINTKDVSLQNAPKIALEKPVVCTPAKVSKKANIDNENTDKTLDLPITTLQGVSATLAKKLAKLNIYNIYNMCTHFPLRHLDYSCLKKINQLQVGNEETIRAVVWEAGVKKNTKGRSSTEAVLGDDSGNVRVLWFNNPYVAKSLKSGDELIISGRVSIVNGRAVFESPEWEKSEKAGIHTGRIVPIYHLTAGLTQRQARKLFKETVESYYQYFNEFLPQKIRQRQQLIELPEAILQAHYPQTIKDKEQARLRLAFDELFILQMGALMRKKRWQQSGQSQTVKINKELLSRFTNALPFSMTEAQKRVCKEILKDICSTTPASRLVQGEVGSGKTVVAALALLLTADDEQQGVLMAPTEVLAEQHFRSLQKLYGYLPCRVEINEDNPYLITIYGLLTDPLQMALLTSEVKGKARTQIYQNVSNGTCRLLIGTHAVIQKDVEFNNLALAVIDEQHRFGVNQRQELRNKGGRPHVIAMTATPIPRTLSLTIYGDLDLSVIDELPEGRQKIKTKWLSPEERLKAYAFIAKQVQDGRQAFVICPLVEESEAIAAKAAASEYQYLSQTVFKNRRMGLVTGRMTGKEKESSMQAFANGEIDILVSTAVVEVGIDVPNATVMLVESAERFGLAQLHQFRGRVGRGEHQSYCLLLSGEQLSAESQNRLRIIEKTQNGFALAEEDLRMRGPGQFFGTRQSGVPELKMARLSDIILLERARKEAERLFAEDPDLQNPQLRLLTKEIAHVWQSVEDKLA